MIDGVKISCIGTTAGDWLDSENLPFALPVSVKTGEVLRKRMFVKHRELVFSVSPDYSRKQSFGRCQLRGSLQKFLSKGANNRPFTHAELCQTVDILKADYSVKPETATLHGVEFGLNLRLDGYTAQQFINALVCLPTVEANDWRNKTAVIGKEFTRAQYGLKIYDKGKQSGTGETDVLRVEMKVNRMQFLKKYGIANLSDLTDAEKVAPLGAVLLRVFNDLIIYDGSIDREKLSYAEREKLDEFRNAETWLKAPYWMRHRLKKQFENLVNQHGNFDLKSYALFELKKTWFELLNLPAKSAEKIPAFSKKHVGATGEDFTFKIKGKNITNSPNTFFLNQGEKTDRETGEDLNPKNAEMIRTFCRVCKRDISKQRANSKMCSVKQYPERGRECEKKYFVMQRKKKTAAQRDREQRDLEKLTKKIKRGGGAGVSPVMVWAVTVERKTADGSECLRLDLSEVSAATVGKIQKVTAATVAPTDGEAVKLTSQRAKNLIRRIYEFNQNHTRKAAAKARKKTDGKSKK